MYKILNFLFGWDYIKWSNYADEGIARIKTDADGVHYFTLYWITGCTATLEEYTTGRGERKILWLTCKSEKYLKN